MAPSADTTMSAPETPGNLTRTVLRGAGLAGAGHVLTQVLSLGVYLALAHLATPHDFGQFAAGSILVGAGLLVSESGMLAAIVQRRDRIEEAASTAFVATVLGGIGLSLLALALAPVVGLFFGSDRVAWVAAAMAGYVALRQTMVVPDALMQRQFSFVRRIVLEPAAAISFGAVAIATTAAGLGVWGLVIGTYAGVVVQIVLSWALVAWRPQRRLVSYAMWRELAGFGRHVIAAEGLRLGGSEARAALIGRYVSTAALGQFGYAVRVAVQPVGIMVNAFSYVLMPALSRIADDEVRFRDATLRALRWMGLLTFPTSLILLALGEPLTVLLFGPEWRPAGRAVAAMCLFSAGSVVVSLASETWKAAGRPHWLPRTHTLGGVLGIVLAVATVHWGLTAVAASLSASAVLTASYALWGVSRTLRVSVAPLLAQLWAPFLAAIVMTAAAYGLESVVDADHHRTLVGLVLIAVEALAAALVYVGALALLSPRAKRDLVAALVAARSRLRPTRAPGTVTPDPLS